MASRPLARTTLFYTKKVGFMQDRDGLIWLDGEWVQWREASVHVLTHTLHYGYGVFEGVRAYKTEKGTAIFRLKEHTQRLFDSAEILGIQIPYSREEVDNAQKDAVRKNKLDTAYIRPLVFLGAESMGLHADNLRVRMMVAAWPWGTYLGEEGLHKGIRVKTSTHPRHHGPEMTKAKACGNYIKSILALREAHEAGYDEALMTDVDGFVCEGSGENVFIVSDGRLHTPPDDYVLNGVTRRTVIELAQEQGIQTVQRRITRDEAYTAAEVFLTGTAAEVTPVREFDGHTIGNGGRGEVTAKLQSLYFDAVHGRLKGHDDWLALL